MHLKFTQRQTFCPNSRNVRVRSAGLDRPGKIDLNRCGANRFKIMWSGMTQMWGGWTQDYVGQNDFGADRHVTKWSPHETFLVALHFVLPSIRFMPNQSRSCGVIFNSYKGNLAQELQYLTRKKKQNKKNTSPF